MAVIESIIGSQATQDELLLIMQSVHYRKDRLDNLAVAVSNNDVDHAKVNVDKFDSWDSKLMELNPFPYRGASFELRCTADGRFTRNDRPLRLIE